MVRELEERKSEITSDLEDRKRSFMADVDIYEDDVTYEVDRVMEAVDELTGEVEDGRRKVDSLIQSVRQLKDETEALIRAELELVKAAGKAAMDGIDEIVAEVKKKLDQAASADTEKALQQDDVIADSFDTPLSAVSPVKSVSGVKRKRDEAELDADDSTDSSYIPSSPSLSYASASSSRDSSETSLRHSPSIGDLECSIFDDQSMDIDGDDIGLVSKEVIQSPSSKRRRVAGLLAAGAMAYIYLGLQAF